MPFFISIVGRPNVGKSTLFNRLIGKNQAIVNNFSGVTRDYQIGYPENDNSNYVFVDTAGVDIRPNDDLEIGIQNMVKSALDISDAFLLVVDAKVGIVSSEFDIAQQIRKLNKPVILVANKSETKIQENLPEEINRFGWGEPHFVSAEHNIGLMDLHHSIQKMCTEHLIHDRIHTDQSNECFNSLVINQENNGQIRNQIKVSVVGRPNAGKSSLINLIIGHERLLTGETPGITRDSISIECSFFGSDLLIYDTAGMRKRSKITNNLEKDAVSESLRVIRFSEIVIVLFDATQALEAQDLRIADLAGKEGRGVLLVANKWDLIKNKEETIKEIQYIINKSLPQLRGLKPITISVKKNQGLKTLHKAIFDLNKTWNKRVETSQLNKWLEMIKIHHPPPAIRGRRIKLRFISQINIRPPSFLVNCNHPRALPQSYRRYMVNELRRCYQFDGTPIRLLFRSNQN